MNSLFGVLALATAGLATPLLLLIAYHRSRGRGLGLVYLVLGIFQLAQYVLAVLWPITVAGTSIFIGSTILFPANLFIILLVNIKYDTYEFRRVCRFLLLVNVVICAVVCTVRLWASDLVLPETLRLVAGPGASRVVVFGTILLVIDAVVMVLLYDLSGARPLLIRLAVPLSIISAIDAIGYSEILSWAKGAGAVENVEGQVAGKVIVSVLYASVLALYIREFEPDLYREQPRAGKGLSVLRYFINTDSPLRPNRRAGLSRERQAALARFISALIRAVDDEGGSFSLACIRPDAGEADDRWRVAVLAALERLTRGRIHAVAFDDGAQELYLVLLGFHDLRTRSFLDQLDAEIAEQLDLANNIRQTWVVYDGRQTSAHLVRAADLMQAAEVGQQHGDEAGQGGCSLTLTQALALARRVGRPLELTDPHTRRLHFLIPADEFARIRLLVAPRLADVGDLPSGVLRSQETLWISLPGLLADPVRRGRWILLHLDRIVETADEPWELYAAAARLDLRVGEWFVGHVVPSLLPPWIPVAVDQLSVEVTW
jgi:hypothetical protein